MRISDWSSDVCSSDLRTRQAARKIESRDGRGDHQLQPPARHDASAVGAEADRRALEAHRIDGNRPEPARKRCDAIDVRYRSEEHTSELQSLMRISYAVFCLKKKKHHIETTLEV